MFLFYFLHVITLITTPEIFEKVLKKKKQKKMSIKFYNKKNILSK